MGLAVPAAAFAFAQPGLDRFSLATANLTGDVDVIATFGGVRPAAGQIDGLRRARLARAADAECPLALLRGPRQAMIDAVMGGLASDVYPNDPIRYAPSPRTWRSRPTRSRRWA